MSTGPGNLNDLMTADAVSKLFGRTRGCVYYWARRGYLRPVRYLGTGRLKGFPAAAVEAVLAGRMTLQESARREEGV